RHRAVVEAEGLVLPDEADLTRVLLLQLRERRLDALAEGALEVREHDDRRARVLRTLDRRVTDLDCPDRRVLRRLLVLVRLRCRGLLPVAVDHPGVEIR